jgi:hypothetical protein
MAPSLTCLRRSAIPWMLEYPGRVSAGFRAAEKWFRRRRDLFRADMPDETILGTGPDLPQCRHTGGL